MSEYIEREPWALRCRKCGWTGTEHHLRPGNYPGLSERGCPNCGAREHNVHRRFQLTIEELTDRLLRTAAASEVQMAKDLLTEAAVNLRSLHAARHRIAARLEELAFAVEGKNGLPSDMAADAARELAEQVRAGHYAPTEEGGE